MKLTVTGHHCNRRRIPACNNIRLCLDHMLNKIIHCLHIQIIGIDHLLFLWSAASRKINRINRMILRQFINHRLPFTIWPPKHSADATVKQGVLHLFLHNIYHQTASYNKTFLLMSTNPSSLTGKKQGGSYHKQHLPQQLQLRFL